MIDRELISHTKRRPMTQARRAKIFLRENGRCYLCGQKLRIGADKYEIEHPTPLALGGSDNDEDLRVICLKCHKPKTARDAGAKAKRDRIVDKGYAGRKTKFRGWRRMNGDPVFADRGD